MIAWRHAECASCLSTSSWCLVSPMCFPWLLRAKQVWDVSQCVTRTLYPKKTRTDNAQTQPNASGGAEHCDLYTTSPYRSWKARREHRETLSKGCIIVASIVASTAASHRIVGNVTPYGSGCQRRGARKSGVAPDLGPAQKLAQASSHKRTASLHPSSECHPKKS